MTDTLQKALSILTAQASNPMALEAIVEAMEACLEGGQYDGIGCSGDSLKATVEAPVKPKHPLEDYQITEKDVGSLVFLQEVGWGRLIYFILLTMGTPIIHLGLKEATGVGRQNHTQTQSNSTSSRTTPLQIVLLQMI